MRSCAADRAAPQPDDPRLYHHPPAAIESMFIPACKQPPDPGAAPVAMAGIAASTPACPRAAARDIGRRAHEAGKSAPWATPLAHPAEPGIEMVVIGHAA